MFLWVQTNVWASTRVSLSAPSVGAFADILGRKRLIVPALLILSLLTGLASTASGLHSIIFWRFLQGLMMAVIFAVSIAYVSEEWTGAGVGAAMAIYVRVLQEINDPKAGILRQRISLP